MLKIEILDVKKKDEGRLLAQFKAKLFFGLDEENGPSITLPKMKLVQFPSGVGVDAPISKTFEKDGEKKYIKAFYPNRSLNELLAVEAEKAYKALPAKEKGTKKVKQTTKAKA